MKKKIKYIKNTKLMENISINLLKKNKNIKIIKQNNIEILFIYKRKICKEKICKITTDFKKNILY
jgi:hypothetical protein